MARKRICVLAAQLEETTQNRFLKSFLKTAYSYDYDVCIFSMYLKYQESSYREVGESNIYSLINYDLFDAVVILQDTIQTPGIAEKIQRRIKSEFDGVVVVVDKESDNFPSIMIDHITPIVKIVDHMIDVHGYKNIYFLNGRKGHIHSAERLKGYKQSMAKHNIPVTDDMIYYGTYWYDSGDYMVDILMKDREHLPDAIVCANDCMAIGVCTAFEKYGVKIPEDICVVGYDSIEDGRNSPVPITSADIPSGPCGEYTAHYVHAKLNGLEVPVFDTEVDLFVGGTCGCCEWKEERQSLRRKEWKTDLSAVSYYSCYNNLMDDLLDQNTEKSFFSTVFQYAYQIRPFNQFSLCLNTYWDNPEVMYGEKALRYGYTDTMYRILNCGNDAETNSYVNFTETFDSKDLIPELFEERDYPTSFIFTPIHFQDRCFGYAVVNFADVPTVYEEVYRVWLKAVMRGLESHVRSNGIKKMLDRIEASQIRDNLTGLLNYKGFVAKCSEFIEAIKGEGKEILATAIDIKNIRDYNDKFGREAGDKLLATVAKVIENSLEPNEMAMRMANDEFVIVSIVSLNETQRGKDLVSAIEAKLTEFNSDEIGLGLYYGFLNEYVTNKDAFEHLVNDAVHVKNSYKAAKKEEYKKDSQLSEDDIKQDRLVEEILDKNLFIYHFQPIVNAKNGNIFGYEALMRANTAERISPPQIIESAERLGRIYEIEKYTFFNVISYIEKHPVMFDGKSVFINSMPNNMLNDVDGPAILKRIQNLNCDVVVEFTENAELDDGALDRFKNALRNAGVKYAIDDYGSGYSNVNNLLRYMPDYVKIDRLLLSGIENDTHKQHFVKDIIEFTADNDIVALAEGVETSEELKTSIDLGANLIQGYYTGKPNEKVAPRIGEKVTYEIIQYNQRQRISDNNRVFNLEYENSLSLLKLATDNYTQVVIKKENSADNRFKLVGAVGFQSDISVIVEDGFNGTLILQNASLAGDKNVPCIELGENVDMFLVLEGENECRTAGIKVPESSRLTVVGDGDINIRAKGSRYYGIGNDMKSRHGILVFKQDGDISINGNGMLGVGIGSGLGGDILIQRGRYDIAVNGQEGVAIGCIEGDANYKIATSDIDIVYDSSNGAVIGSFKGNASVSVQDTSLIVRGSGNKYVCMGTLEGNEVEISLNRVHADFNIKGIQCIGMGSQKGEVNIDVQDASLRMQIQGTDSRAVGSEDNKGTFTSKNADVDISVKNKSGFDFLIPEENISLVNGRCSFVVNNEVKERLVLDEF